MPEIDLEGCRLHYRLDGPDGAPVLLFSNSLGATLEMWRPQIPALAARLRTLRYDSRGHGRSSVTPGPTASTASAGTPWACSMRWRSTAPMSVACRSAAWSANGWASTPPIGSTA